MISKNKKICFVCIVPFHYYVFKNVYEEIENAEFVLMPAPLLTDEKLEIEEGLKNLKDFFNEKKINFVEYQKSEQNFFDKYDAVVSCYWLDIEDFINTKAKHIRMLYGLAKDKWNYSPWNACYDLILCYGKSSYSALKEFSNSKIVGIPKYDHYFDGSDMKSKISGLDERKKTVLYLPTWSDLSSFDRFFGAFQGLKGYNLIIKPHHVTSLMESGRIEVLNQSDNVIVTSDQRDLGELLNISDLVLSDYSGAIFEAMLFNKKIILLDVENVIDDKSSHSNVMTKEESLEFEVRGFVEHCNDPKKLNAQIDKVIKTDVDYDKFTGNLYERSLLGKSSKEAAKVIRDFLKGETKDEYSEKTRHYVKDLRKTNLFVRLENEENKRRSTIFEKDLSIEKEKREFLEYCLDQIHKSKGWRFARIISFLIHPYKFLKAPNKREQLAEFIGYFGPLAFVIKLIFLKPINLVFLFYSRLFASVIKLRLKRILKKDDKIVIYPPTVDWSWMKQRPHQIMEGLAKRGYVCLYVNINHREGTKRNYFKKIEKNLFVLGSMELLPKIDSPILYISWTKHFDILSKFKEPTVIYDFLDDLTVSAEDVDMEKLKHHQYFLKKADLVCVTADKLEKDAQVFRKDTLMLPNAANYDDFHLKTEPGAPKDLKKILAQKKKIVGYYGALAKWFDYNLLKETAKNRKDINFVLIGPDYDDSIHKEHLDEIENVHWLGIKGYDDLPEYLHYFDVATIPFLVNEITRATSPVKIFEYMAGGKPIISTPLNECMKYKSVLIAKDAEEFSKKIDEALNLAGEEDYKKILEKEARENTWDDRIEKIERELAKVRNKK